MYLTTYPSPWSERWYSRGVLVSSHSDHPPQPQLSSLGWACTGPGRTVSPPHCVASVSVHVCVWMRHIYILGEFSAFLASRASPSCDENKPFCHNTYNITVCAVPVTNRSACWHNKVGSLHSPKVCPLSYVTLEFLGISLKAHSTIRTYL